MLREIIILVLLLVVFPLLTKGQEMTYNVETASVHPNVDKILNGLITKEGLQQLPYKIWFNTNYKTYQVDNQTLQAIKKRKLKGLEILVFMGTWCHDSNREIPRLLKVAETMGIADQMTLYGVDTNKESKEGKESGFDLQKTPTIIFLKDGREIARILEKPLHSFEKDMVEILNR